MEDWVVLTMFVTLSIGTGVAWLGRVIERWHMRSCLTVVVCEVVKNAHPLFEIMSKNCCGPPEAPRNNAPRNDNRAVPRDPDPPHNPNGR